MGLSHQFLMIWSYSSIETRYTILFLFVLAGRLIVFSIRNWWIMGFTSFLPRIQLRKIVAAAGQRDFAALKLLAQRISRRTPEGGLRQLESIDVEAIPSNFEKIIDLADRHFRDKQDRLQYALTNLSRWRNLTLWVLAANLFGQIADAMPEFLHRSGCDYGDCGDGRPLIPFIVSIGLWLIVILYILQWRFEGRLRVRIALWGRLLAEIKPPAIQQNASDENGRA